MSAKIRALQAKKVEQIKAARDFNDAIDTKASAEGRGWSAEETAQFDGLRAAIDATTSQINREQMMANDEAGMAAIVAANQPRAPPAAPAAVVTTRTPIAQISVHDNREDDPRRGFRSFGEFAQTVFGAAVNQRAGISVDQRLLIGGGGVNAAAPTTFGNEGSGADGGFAVPPEYARNIFALSLGEDSLLPYTDNTPVLSNSMVFPKDETTPWGTDGVRAYWQGEAVAGTQTKPKLGSLALRLKKLMALVPLSDELVEDTTALGAWLPGKIGDSMRWKMNEAILFGAGNVTPFGALLAGGAVVTITKDSGQAANTLSALNLANMIARLPAGSYPKSVWLINNDVLPALFTMTLGNYPIYMPGGAQVAGGIQSNPYGMLLGRPIMISQHAKSFSSQGDVILVDLSYYQAITKAEGFETATSLHLYFDADAVAFRTTFRMDGQPKIAAAISPANGSNSLSPFVQLGAR